MPKRLLLIATAFMLGGCPPPSETSNGTADPPASVESFTENSACSLEGLDAPLRSTVIAIDLNTLNQASTLEEFIETNAPVRDAVLAFSDPQRALRSGRVAPRERISIIGLPRDGGAATQYFTGCVPGVGVSERTAIEGDSSTVSDFFSGGFEQRLEELTRNYRSKLIASLQSAARSSGGEATAPRGGIEELSALASLASSSGLIDGGEGALRLVLITDLGRAEDYAGLPMPSLRQAAMADEQRQPALLAGSDIILVSRSGVSPEQRTFLDAYMLARRGRLVFAGDSADGATGLSEPPERLLRFVGTAGFPGYRTDVQIRLGLDANGALTNSWIILRDDQSRAIPLLGQAVCEDGDVCTIRSSDYGFAQIWTLEPGGSPEIEGDMPFSGMRSFTIDVDGDELTARITDPLVDQVGEDPSNDAITITASLQEQATF